MNVVNRNLKIIFPGYSFLIKVIFATLYVFEDSQNGAYITVDFIYADRLIPDCKIRKFIGGGEEALAELVMKKGVGGWYWWLALVAGHFCGLSPNYGG
jgi:hypothetical protein